MYIYSKQRFWLSRYDGVIRQGIRISDDPWSKVIITKRCILFQFMYKLSTYTFSFEINRALLNIFVSRETLHTYMRQTQKKQDLEQ